MISKLWLTNVQSHKGTEFDFVPGVNVITGPSDVGKSTVIRAIEWAALNKPAGDGIRRHDTKSTRVTLNTVTKQRSASKHQYEFKGAVFKALRTNVPDPIRTELNLTDVNFQRQHDPYFLIGDSPGQVAKTLNEVADLQIIDLSLKEARQLARAAKAEKKILNSQLETQQGKVEELHWVKGADKLYQRIEALRAQALALAGSITALEEKTSIANRKLSDFSLIPETGIDRERMRDLRDRFPDWGPLSSAVSKVKDNQVIIPDPSPDITQLTTFIDVLAQSQEDDLRELLTTTRALVDDVLWYPDLADPSTSLDPLIQITANHDALTDVIKSVKALENNRIDVTDDYESGKHEYEQKMQDVGLCPLCGGTL